MAEPVWRLTVVVDRAGANALDAAFEAAFDGADTPPSLAAFEIEDAGDWRVEAYFAGPPDHARLDAALTAAERLAGRPLPPADLAPLPDTDWVGESQKHLQPVLAGRLFVHGSHDRDRARPGRINLLVEAGQAFGTGHHETTKGCLLTLDRLARHARPRSALDLGSGSGVLAMAVARLWHMPVIAGDIDPVATATARDNLRVNRIPARPSCVPAWTRGWGVALLTAAGMDHPALRSGPGFDLVTANILAGPLKRLAPVLAPRVASGGYLVLSGLLRAQESKVLAAYRQRGLFLIERRILGQWPTLLLRRGGRAVTHPQAALSEPPVFRSDPTGFNSTR